MERKLRLLLPGGRFRNVSANRSRTMGAIRSKHAKTTERALRMILIRGGIKGWRMHPSGIPGNPDIYFPAQNTVVFVDGCFWHGCPKCGHTPKTRSAFWKAKIIKNRQRDRRTRRNLRRSGLKVIGVWEHSLRDDKYVQRLVARVRALTQT